MNKNYYLGSYTIRLFAFQKFKISELFPKLCISLNVRKFYNDLEVFKVIFNSIISDIIDNYKLALSYVSEMIYVCASKYKSIELDYDVNEFENSRRFAVYTLITITPSNYSESAVAILYLLLIRQILYTEYVINFSRIIWLFVGLPAVLYI